jgi:hypothetical protein
LSAFDRIPRDSNGQHPVDVDVDKQLRNRVRQRWIIKLQDRIIQLTGVHSRLFLKLESMLAEEGRERERCYFNVGYELGRSAAREDNGRRRPHQERAAILVNELRAKAHKEGIPPRELMNELLRCALSIGEA